jgi:lipopolysaccharide/colanic/teichoic acid biosynthesis glycosyltransferase
MSLWIKRVIDIVASALGLIVLSPIIGAAALLIRVTMGKPVLFRQQRPGLNEEPFELVKFRTMTVGDPNVIDPEQDAVRMTTVGRMLRRTSIDELPQLWNVLRGEMSLVGPRPLLMEYLPLYSTEQHRRHDVRPGITGWSQVIGRNELSWQDKFKLDVWYVDNRSLLLDMRIILLTIRRVFAGSGVSAAGHASMAKFTGNSRADATLPSEATR